MKVYKTRYLNIPIYTCFLHTHIYINVYTYIYVFKMRKKKLPNIYQVTCIDK